jgi:hypothetical protein
MHICFPKVTCYQATVAVQPCKAHRPSLPAASPPTHHQQEKVTGSITELYSFIDASNGTLDKKVLGELAEEEEEGGQVGCWQLPRPLTRPAGVPLINHLCGCVC